MNSCNALFCFYSSAAPASTWGLKFDSGTAILISATVAFAGWIHSSRSARVAGRRAHTYTIVNDHQTNTDLNASFEVIRKITKAGTPIRREQAMTPFYDDFDRIIDHYEYVSAAIMCGDVDEKLMKRCEQTRFVKLGIIFKEYIEQVRVEEKQPTYCANLMEISNRWLKGRSAVSVPRRWMEWWLLHPFDSGRSVFSMVKDKLGVDRWDRNRSKS